MVRRRRREISIRRRLMVRSSRRAGAVRLYDALRRAAEPPAGHRTKDVARRRPRTAGLARAAAARADSLRRGDLIWSLARAFAERCQSRRPAQIARSSHERIPGRAFWEVTMGRWSRNINLLCTKMTAKRVIRPGDLNQPQSSAAAQGAALVGEDLRPRRAKGGSIW